MGRRLGGQRLERINGRLVSVPDIGPRPTWAHVPEVERAIDASGHRVWFNGLVWFHEDPDDDAGCAGAMPTSGRSAR